MSQPKQLDRNFTLSPSMDFSFLIRKGTEYSQKLSGEVWTDYNAHDPGVTILEQLVYGMVDVAYRTNFDFEDLMFSADADSKSTALNNAFFDPLDILTVGPTIIHDFRKLLIDHVTELSNVWIERANNSIQGTYQIYLQIDKHVYDLEIEKVKLKVSRLFAAHRNLCEDINEIIVLKPLELVVHGDLNLSKDINLELLLANILFDIEQYLNPNIEFYTYSDLSREEVFDSPKPIHGFVKTSNLKPKGASFSYSKILELFSQRMGIRDIANFKITKAFDGEVEEEVIEVPFDSFFFLNINTTLNSLRLFQDGFRSTFDIGAVRRLFQMLKNQSQKSYDIRSGFDKSSSVFKTSSLAGLDQYSSIQNSFPLVYGIGQKGLGENVGKKRLAEAKQLKAYLFFHDQILANHLSQVSNLPHFFSIDENIDKTYFHQFPDSIQGMEDLLSVDKETFLQNMNSYLNNEDDFLERRNKVLNHLLSRFSEDGNSFLPPKGQSDTDQLKSLIKRKSKLLKNYVTMSKFRGKGVDYSRAIDSENQPEFVKKIALQLDLNYSHRRLSDLGGLKAKASVNNPESNSEERNEIETENQNHFKFQSRNPGILKHLFVNGGDKTNYYLGKPTEKEEFPLNFKMGDEELHIINVKTINQYEEVVNRLVEKFNTLNSFCEGFHVIEHLLLRPLQKQKYDFVIYNQEERPFIISEIEDDLETQKEKILLILIKGTNSTTFKTREVEDGKLEIYLYDSLNDQSLGCFFEHFETEAEALDGITNAINYIKYIQQSESVALSKIEYVATDIQGNHISSDFYSKTISIVFPNWTRRFQNLEFVELFKKLVGENTPAHIHINFIPLTLGKMKEFEDLYFSWVAIRHNPQEIEDNIKHLDDKAFALIKFFEGI